MNTQFSLALDLSMPGKSLLIAMSMIICLVVCKGGISGKRWFYRTSGLDAI